MMKQMLLMAVAGLFLLTGCTTEDEFECPQSYTGALTAEEQALVGNWKLSALEGSVAIDLSDDETDNASTDLYSQLDACVRGARYLLSESRTMTYYGSRLNEGVCEEELFFSGSWKSDGEVLQILAGCAVAAFDVESGAEVSTFSYTVNEQVYDYNGVVIPMQLTYTFRRLLEEI